MDRAARSLWLAHLARVPRAVPGEARLFWALQWLWGRLLPGRAVPGGRACVVTPLGAALLRLPCRSGLRAASAVPSHGPALPAPLLHMTALPSPGPAPAPGSAARLQLAPEPQLRSGDVAGSAAGPLPESRPSCCLHPVLPPVPSHPGGKAPLCFSSKVTLAVETWRFQTFSLRMVYQGAPG